MTPAVWLHLYGTFAKIFGVGPLCATCALAGPFRAAGGERREDGCHMLWKPKATEGGPADLDTQYGPCVYIERSMGKESLRQNLSSTSPPQNARGVTANCLQGKVLQLRRDMCVHWCAWRRRGAWRPVRRTLTFCFGFLLEPEVKAGPSRVSKLSARFALRQLSTPVAPARCCARASAANHI